MILIITLFYPALQLFFAKSQDQTSGLKYRGNLTANDSSIDQTQLKPIPEQNTLVIPKIYVDAKINQGQNSQTLNKGFWHIPNTSSPDMGGNMVIAGHRFAELTGPNTFYHLDRRESPMKLEILDITYRRNNSNKQCYHYLYWRNSANFK